MASRRKGRGKGRNDAPEERAPITQPGPVPAMSLEQIEERLVKSILSGTLALHILRSSRKPLSGLVKELMDMEVEVGKFVGAAVQMHAESLKRTEMKGMLAGALSFIPIPTTAPPPINPKNIKPSLQIPKRTKWRLARGKARKNRIRH